VQSVGISDESVTIEVETPSAKPDTMYVLIKMPNLNIFFYYSDLEMARKNIGREDIDTLFSKFNHGIMLDEGV